MSGESTNGRVGFKPLVTAAVYGIGIGVRECPGLVGGREAVW